MTDTPAPAEPVPAEPVSGEPVTAAVLVIGDEILTGRTQDTNVAAIAKFVGAHGVDLKEVRVIGDEQGEIVAALDALRTRYAYVFTTGGIGPTHDDITADAVAAAFGVPLHQHPEIVAMLEARWGQGQVNEARLRMARVPEGGTLVRNPVNGPPGFQIGNVFVLAGVPSIMRGMLEDIGWRLQGGAVVVSRTLHVEGAGEGEMAAPLAAVAKAHPALALGSYPFFSPAGYGSNLVVRGRDPAAVGAVLAELESALRAAGVTDIREIDGDAKS